MFRIEENKAQLIKVRRTNFLSIQHHALQFTSHERTLVFGHLTSNSYPKFNTYNR